MNKAEIPVAQRTVLSMLLDDHREVRKLFKDFAQEKHEVNRESIAREACEKLKRRFSIPLCGNRTTTPSGIW